MNFYQQPDSNIDNNSNENTENEEIIYPSHHSRDPKDSQLSMNADVFTYCLLILIG